MSMIAGHVHDVKSSKFIDASMFPRCNENIDEMFQNYFSMQSMDHCFIDLHGELQRIDLDS